MRSWSIAPALALLSVLSACSGSNDDLDPAKDLRRPSNVPTEIYQQFEEIGYQCVPRDTGNEANLGSKCAVVADDQSRRVVSFVTSGDELLSWAVTLDPLDRTWADADELGAAVRPALEVLAGEDAEQAVSYAVDFATDLGPDPGRGLVEDAVGVMGSEFQLTASYSGHLGHNFAGVRLGADVPDASPTELTTVTFAEVDAKAMTGPLTDAGFTCRGGDDPSTALRCEQAVSIQVIVSEGQAESISILVYDDDPDQVAELGDIADALNAGINTDGDFSDVFDETAEGSDRYIQQVGDFLFLVEGFTDPKGHLTNYETL